MREKEEVTNRLLVEFTVRLNQDARPGMPMGEQTQVRVLDWPMPLAVHVAMLH